jgi:hypothetical protein
MNNLEIIMQEFHDWRYIVTRPMTEIEAAYSFIEEFGYHIDPTDLIEE